MIAAATSVAAIVTVLLTPAAAALARRSGTVAKPRADRWHTSPTPMLGGIALATGVIVPLVAFIDRSIAIVLLAAFASTLLGLTDDVRHISPSSKLVGQVLIATGLYLGGVNVEVIPVAPVAFLLTVLWVVGIMNAINLLDNMDGLAAGISLTAASVLLIDTAARNPDAAVIAGVTAGAAAGFLIHNFPPARVFMGDAGSQLLGVLLASTALLQTIGAASSLSLVIVAPIFVLALPIFDVAFVTMTRRLRGSPISRGGRDHTSHRLTALGISERATVLGLYGVAAFLGVLGIVGQTLSPLVLPLLVLSVVGLALFGVFLWQADSMTTQAATTPASRMSRTLSTYARFGFEIGLDVLLLTTAYFTAFAMRFEGVPFSFWSQPFGLTLPIVVAAQLAVLVLLGVYRTLWRHIALEDTVLILRAITLGSAVAALAVFMVLEVPGVSRAAILIDWVLATGFVIGARMFLVWLRRWFARRPRAGDRRVLIIGASDHGELALRLLSRSPQGGFRMIGFLDDDPGKRYRRLAGIPVLGTTSELAAVVRERSIDTVIVATEGGDGAARVREVCQELGLDCREFVFQ